MAASPTLVLPARSANLAAEIIRVLRERKLFNLAAAERAGVAEPTSLVSATPI